MEAPTVRIAENLTLEATTLWVTSDLLTQSLFHRNQPEASTSSYTKLLLVDFYFSFIEQLLSL
ncbi:hypothetical protein [Microseira sp. BLCC-F43]|uniref:hypothetical protein n=1 Tax=Microseira sp. BLCC-F43 TaxID=3153602 RepID=UPI0035BA7111